MPPDCEVCGRENGGSFKLPDHRACCEECWVAAGCNIVTLHATEQSDEPILVGGA